MLQILLAVVAILRYILCLWRLKSFAPDGKRTIVLDWFREQSDAVQASFEVRLKFLMSQPPEAWQRPYVAKLRGECKGLYEIRFEVGNVQHRPIGYFSAESEFTILAFATERGSKFNPHNVCQTANNRKRLIEQRKELALEFKFQN
jgi:hypothetical protein